MQRSLAMYLSMNRHPNYSPSIVVAFAMGDLDTVNSTRKACNQLFRCIDEQMIAAG